MAGEVAADFERDGGLAAIGVAVVGLLHAFAFVIVGDDLRFPRSWPDSSPVPRGGSGWASS